MAKLLSFRAIGFREAKGRFAAKARFLQIEKREMVRDVSRDYRDALRVEAPKKTEIFANGIAFKTFERGNVTYSTLYVAGPHAFLKDIIIKGSRPHPIPTGGAAEMMAKGYPLSFFWAKGPQGAKVYHFWSVNHPGTKPNDFVTRTQVRMQAPAQARLNLVSARVASL